MKNIYELEDKNGVYFIDDEETVWRPSEKPYAKLEKLLKSGEAKIVPYDGSPLQKKREEAEQNRAAEKARLWRDQELKASDIELLRALENGEDITELKTRRQALRDYPNDDKFPNNKRP